MPRRNKRRKGGGTPFAGNKRRKKGRRINRTNNHGREPKTFFGGVMDTEEGHKRSYYIMVDGSPLRIRMVKGEKIEDTVKRLRNDEGLPVWDYYEIQSLMAWSDIEIEYTHGEI